MNPCTKTYSFDFGLLFYYHIFMSSESIKSPAERHIVYARAEIDRRLAIGPDEVDGLFGITVVERSENRPRGEDCQRYTFGQVDEQKLYDEIMSTHRELDLWREQRQSGDIVIYSNDGKTILHVGRVAPNGKDVISKWGPGGHDIFSPF